MDQGRTIKSSRLTRQYQIKRRLPLGKTGVSKVIDTCCNRCYTTLTEYKVYVDDNAVRDSVRGVEEDCICDMIRQCTQQININIYIYRAGQTISAQLYARFGKGGGK